jgi:hypothetical protein
VILGYPTKGGVMFGGFPGVVSPLGSFEGLGPQQTLPTGHPDLNRSPSFITTFGIRKIR